MLMSRVLRVFIASPGDTLEQRNIIRQIVHEWNSAHAVKNNLFLMPVGWEKEGAAWSGDSAQSILNSQLLQDSDLLVGVICNKLGTKTSNYESGTVEEIETHLKNKKPAMIYFLAPSLLSAEENERTRIENFRESIKVKGLYFEFENANHFKEIFRQQFATNINSYFSNQKINHKFTITKEEGVIKLNEVAEEILTKAVNSQKGFILVTSTHSGFQIISDNKNLVHDQSPKHVAICKQAIKELKTSGLIHDERGKGEYFEITADGYDYIEIINNQLSRKYSR